MINPSEEFKRADGCLEEVPESSSNEHEQSLECNQRENQINGDTSQDLDNTFNRSKTFNLNNTADNIAEDVFEGEHTEGNKWDLHQNCEVERTDNVQVDEARGLNFDRELHDEVILSFFGENELTESEMDWLKSHGELSEFEVLKLISKIIKKRASS